MIRRESEDGWTLFAQHDHALLSFRIMSFWGNEKFSGIVPEEEVMTAIREHDCGWRKTDSSPELNPRNGFPRSFTEMRTEEQFRIWSDCFESRAESRPYAAALIALHFSTFNEKNIARDPGDPSALALREKIREFVFENLAVPPAGGDLNGGLPLDVRTNLRLLQVGDVISLALCHGWRSLAIADVPVNYSGDSVDVTLASRDGLNYSISPNPFSEDFLSFELAGARLGKKSFGGREELAAAFRGAPAETLGFAIRSGGEG